MSEQGREPLIRLPVDQEVYMEQVHRGDSVEDATVATEVVSFERDGSAYELEGAIVFAGYVRRAGQGASTEASDHHADQVVHVHHRLPFTLRVPVSAQNGGFVNVKSRLSNFSLTVATDNWLNAKGTLEVHGLIPDQGYHFRCGAQEVGQGFSADEELDAVQNEPVAAGDLWRHDDAADESNQADTKEEEALRSSDRSVDHADLEAINQARAGHGWAEEGERVEGDEVDREEADNTQPVRNELANLDRYFVDPPEPTVTGQPVLEERSNPPVASFEFEHQLEEEAAQNFVTRTPDSEDYRNDAAQMPKFSIAGAVDFAPAPKEEEVLDEEPLRTEGTSSVTQNGLWSFVDFNGPEPRHTLRYVIVLEEETLEAVADRCGVLTSELQRVNPTLQGVVSPGQALYIPNSPFSLRRSTPA